jgi:hypothetical protein
VLVATHGRGLFYGTWNYNPGTGISDRYSMANDIYPNPAYGNIQVNCKQDAEITIFSTNGSIEMKTRIGAPGADLDITNLNPGIYFVRIKETTGSTVLKLVVK